MRDNGKIDNSIIVTDAVKGFLGYYKALLPDEVLIVLPNFLRPSDNIRDEEVRKNLAECVLDVSKNCKDRHYIAFNSLLMAISLTEEGTQLRRDYIDEIGKQKVAFIQSLPDSSTKMSSNKKLSKEFEDAMLRLAEKDRRKFIGKGNVGSKIEHPAP